jgi:hypothetical protein
MASFEQGWSNRAAIIARTRSRSRHRLATNLLGDWLRVRLDPQQRNQ